MLRKDRLRGRSSNRYFWMIHRAGCAGPAADLLRSSVGSFYGLQTLLCGLILLAVLYQPASFNHLPRQFHRA